MSKERRKKWRIAQLSCDWKECFTAKEINRAIRDVGEAACLYDHSQGDVDAKVMYVSSEKLNQTQLDLLWSAGDLMMGDKDVWEGDLFLNVVSQIREYVKNNTDNTTTEDAPQEVECPECNQPIQFHCVEGNHRFL